MNQDVAEAVGREMTARFLNMVQQLSDVRNKPAIKRLGITDEDLIDKLMTSSPREIQLMAQGIPLGTFRPNEQLIAMALEDAAKHATRERQVNDFMRLGANKQCMMHYFGTTSREWLKLCKGYGLPPTPGGKPKKLNYQQQRVVERVVRISGFPDADRAIELAEELSVAMRTLWYELRGYAGYGGDDEGAVTMPSSLTRSVA